MGFPKSPTKFLDLPVEAIVTICWLSGSLKNLPLICKHLRDTIYLAPFLWGRISIVIEQDAEKTPLSLEEHLKRSAKCPLEVRVDARAERTDGLLIDTDLFSKLLAHKERICTFDITTNSVELCQTILHFSLLGSNHSSLPSLRSMCIRETGDMEGYFDSDIGAGLLRNLDPAPFTSLTTLNLPFTAEYMPSLKSPMPSLKTLVLDGTRNSLERSEAAYVFQITKLLAQTSNLETIWFKIESMQTDDDVLDDFIPEDEDEPPSPHVVDLPWLTRLAIFGFGKGEELLRFIRAPNLQDLHIDGTSDRDKSFYDLADWAREHVLYLLPTLKTLATRSPLLRRLAIVGVNLTRDTWQWLLGCELAESVPFPLLESIAVRGMQETTFDVPNAVDDGLLDKLAAAGRIRLRRFAYLNSSPRLGAGALQRLAFAMSSEQASGEHFELEFDERSGPEKAVVWQNELSGTGTKVIFHDEPLELKAWWDRPVDEDVDACEKDSY